MEQQLRRKIEMEQEEKAAAAARAAQQQQAQRLVGAPSMAPAPAVGRQEGVSRSEAQAAAEAKAMQEARVEAMQRAEAEARRAAKAQTAVEREAANQASKSKAALAKEEAEQLQNASLARMEALAKEEARQKRAAQQAKEAQEREDMKLFKEARQSGGGGMTSGGYEPSAAEIKAVRQAEKAEKDRAMNANKWWAKEEVVGGTSIQTKKPPPRPSSTSPPQTRVSFERPSTAGNKTPPTGKKAPPIDVSDNDWISTADMVGPQNAWLQRDRAKRAQPRKPTNLNNWMQKDTPRDQSEETKKMLRANDPKLKTFLPLSDRDKPPTRAKVEEMLQEQKNGLMGQIGHEVTAGVDRLFGRPRRMSMGEEEYGMTLAEATAMKEREEKVAKEVMEARQRDKEYAEKRRKEQQPYLEPATGTYPNRTSTHHPDLHLSDEGTDALKTALRRENMERVRLILATSPSRDVIVTAAAQANIDLEGSSECARLLRAALMREQRAMADAAGGGTVRGGLELAKGEEGRGEGAEAAAEGESVVIPCDLNVKAIFLPTSRAFLALASELLIRSMCCCCLLALHPRCWPLPPPPRPPLPPSPPPRFCTHRTRLPAP